MNCQECGQECEYDDFYETYFCIKCQLNYRADDEEEDLLTW